MIYYWRRNKFKIVGIVFFILVALFVFAPSPQANLNQPSYTDSLVSVDVCNETISQAEYIYKKYSFFFVSAIIIEDNKNMDTITIFISDKYKLISYLTSKSGCVIDATTIEFRETL